MYGSIQLLYQIMGWTPPPFLGTFPAEWLNSNTYFTYGVGDEYCFGYRIGKAICRGQCLSQDRLESTTTIAEALVTKSEYAVALRVNYLH